MEKIEDCPRKKIISVRISDEQMLLLKRVMKKRKVTVSDLIREALSSLDMLSENSLEN